MMKYILVVLFFTSFLNSAQAISGHRIEDYSSGSYYRDYDLVQRNEVVYECKVAGWCNQGGPYTPGIGWAWREAWDELGHRHHGRLSSILYREFHAGERYAVGDVVLHQGDFYECKIEGWCSIAAAAYEPGEGRAWFDAWQFFPE